MQVLNDNSTANLPQKAENMLTGKSGEVHHDFFAPLNELDPMTKKPFKDVPPPKFQFRVFHLAGTSACPEEANEYTRVMNEIVAGNYFRIEEQTYHTKDGDIQVLLRWLEVSEEELKLRESMKKASEEALKSVTEAERKAEEEAAKEEKKKKAAMSAAIADEAACPAPEPKIVM